MVYENQHIAAPSIIKSCSRTRAWYERVRENKHHISNLYKFKPLVAKQHLVSGMTCTFSIFRAVGFPSWLQDAPSESILSNWLAKRGETIWAFTHFPPSLKCQPPPLCMDNPCVAAVQPRLSVSCRSLRRKPGIPDPCRQATQEIDDALLLNIVMSHLRIFSSKVLLILHWRHFWIPGTLRIHLFCEKSVLCANAQPQLWTSFQLYLLPLSLTRPCLQKSEQKQHRMRSQFSWTSKRRWRRPAAAAQGSTTKRQPMETLGWNTSLSSQGRSGQKDRKEKGRGTTRAVKVLHWPVGRAGRWPLFWPRFASYRRTRARQHWFGSCSNRGSRLRGQAQLLQRSSRAEQRGKSPGTPALRPKGKSSIWKKAPKLPTLPSLEAPGSAALSAFPLFVLRPLPARWKSELRSQKFQTHLMTGKAVCHQTPCKCRGCSGHHASSLPQA